MWPLFGLVLRTRRLELRLPRLEQLAALADLADGGVHDPAAMPFLTSWTDLPPGERGRSVLQWQWKTWAGLTPQKWALGLVVLAGGEVVGTQEISGDDFTITREVATGSWLGLGHHRRGIGTEMRAAVLELAFTGLGAEAATSSAFVDNPASLGVSRRLGYVPDGIERHAVRDRLQLDQRLRLDRGDWERCRTVPVTIEGLEPCRELLGASRGA